MDSIKVGIAERLAEVLEEKGENASSLAKKLNKPSSNIYGLVDKTRDHLPNVRLLIQIMEQFPNLSHTWFLTGVGPKWINDEIFEHCITKIETWQTFVDLIEELIPTDNEEKWKKYKRGLYVSFHGWNEFSSFDKRENDTKLIEMSETIENLKSEVARLTP